MGGETLGLGLNIKALKMIFWCPWCPQKTIILSPLKKKVMLKLEPQPLKRGTYTISHRIHVWYIYLHLP